MTMTKPYSYSKKYIDQLKRIELQINSGQLQEAVNLLNTLVRSAPHDPRLFLLGSALAESAGNAEGMLIAAEKAHELAPEWSVATLHLAGIRAGRNQVSDAINLAQRALAQASSQGKAGNIDQLTKAAFVAQRVKQFDKALLWLREAAALAPGDMGLLYKIARTLSASGNDTEAISTYSEILSHVPNNPTLLLDRLEAYLRVDQRSLAILDAATLLTIEPENPVYLFCSALANGESPANLPSELIIRLFNDVPDVFFIDSAASESARLSNDVAKLIHDWSSDRHFDVLDLGCGTGKLGVALGVIEGVLVGVDLSYNMIKHASHMRVYDKFHNVNLLDALRETPENQFHVIAALDVLTYVGQLDTVISDAYRVLLPGGHFVFTCEIASDDAVGYYLQSNYRYAHQTSYVRHLLTVAGFDSIQFENRQLFVEGGNPVSGILVIAVKPPERIARKRSKSAKLAPPLQE